MLGVEVEAAVVVEVEEEEERAEGARAERTDEVREMP